MTLDRAVKRCTCVNKQRNSGNRCIRSKISEYHLDLWTWLNSVQMRTPTGSRSNNYITRCHRRLESVGVRVAVPVGDKITEWEPAPDRGLGPSGPTVEQPSRMKKKCCYSQRNLGSVYSSLSPSPTHLSHATNINPFATLSRIKCERYIFIKKRVRFVHWILSLQSLFFRVYLYMYYAYVLWVYNNWINLFIYILFTREQVLLENPTTTGQSTSLIVWFHFQTIIYHSLP